MSSQSHSLLLINTHSCLEFLGVFLVFCRSVSRGSQVWAPEGSTAFKCLLSARFCAALLSNISDCDETFNYWEPVSNKFKRLKLDRRLPASLTAHHFLP